MIRAAIADYIRAKAEKLRHAHKWDLIDSARMHEQSGRGVPIRYEYLYCCRGCGEFRKVTLP